MLHSDNDTPNGTPEEPLYLLQNWRSDVVFALEATGSGNGEQVENVRYEAYGVPTSLPAGDTDRDGDTDAGDVTQIDTWISGTTWAARGDLDLDNDVDAADKTLAMGMSSANGGRHILSDRGNRKGYAGYEWDLYAVHDSWNVRHRALDSSVGTWTRRDPINYSDGPNLYLYVSGQPQTLADPQGLAATVQDCVDGCTGQWAVYTTPWWDCMNNCMGGAPYSVPDLGHWNNPWFTAAPCPGWVVVPTCIACASCFIIPNPSCILTCATCSYCLAPKSPYYVAPAQPYVHPNPLPDMVPTYRPRDREPEPTLPGWWDGRRRVFHGLSFFIASPPTSPPLQNTPDG